MVPDTDRDEEVAALLERAAVGDRQSFDALFDILYNELRRLARQVRRGRASETLSTTVLVHEAYIRLLPSRGLAWSGRPHFMAVAARAMRQVLVRAAEQRTTAKRGGGHVPVELDESLHPGMGDRVADPERILALDAAVARLESFSPRQARVVEYRFFAGLSVEETARALEISEPTVKRDWRAARAWLAREMSA
jgi:RNA polymerase sigma factor (TIGR02999 family)